MAKDGVLLQGSTSNPTPDISPAFCWYTEKMKSDTIEPITFSTNFLLSFILFDVMIWNF